MRQVKGRTYDTVRNSVDSIRLYQIPESVEKLSQPQPSLGLWVSKEHRIQLY